jgi:hypothetical protein
VLLSQLSLWADGRVLQAKSSSLNPKPQTSNPKQALTEQLLAVSCYFGPKTKSSEKSMSLQSKCCMALTFENLYLCAAGCGLNLEHTSPKP